MNKLQIFIYLNQHYNLHQSIRHPISTKCANLSKSENKRFKGSDVRVANLYMRNSNILSQDIDANMKDRFSDKRDINLVVDAVRALN